jgi:NAD(P)-dependent dehydrogenase (short-subunit alcohol dehydrogenase family)
MRWRFALFPHQDKVEHATNLTSVFDPNNHFSNMIVDNILINLTCLRRNRFVIRGGSAVSGANAAFEMTLERPLAGRRVLITGAASGIGQATARRFADAGATLGLLDAQAAPLDALSRELECAAETLDLADESSVITAVARLGETLGGIDGVLNVAGIGGAMAPLANATLADWNRVIAVNLTAPFLICREALTFLNQAVDPFIVNVASAAGLMPDGAGLLAYATSKGGMITLTKALAHELAPHIRVNVVCPGPVDTPLLPRAVYEYISSRESPYLLKRVANPSEIVSSLLFLSGSESSFITGITLAVDGGRTRH